MNNSISLIGMAGAGKSSIGTELAKQLNFQFIDSDALIEAKFNQTLQNILDDSGYLKLRDIEEETILSIELVNSILATGGSAVYSARAMEYLQQNSFPSISRLCASFNDEQSANHDYVSEAANVNIWSFASERENLEKAMKFYELLQKKFNRC